MYVCVLTFSNISSETTGPIEAKFHVEPPCDGGMKVYPNGPGHITKMTEMPICGKNLKTPEPKIDDLETWYAVTSARVLTRFYFK